jgi:quinol monooxygenase YgiN
MTVTYLIKFNVKPEQRERFLSLLGDVLDAMRKESSFHDAVLHRDPQSEYRFMLYETWQSHDDVMNVQIHRPYRKAWHDALPEILAAERDISIWEPMRTDRKAQPVS